MQKFGVDIHRLPHSSHDRIMMCSPFREETSPSFCITNDRLWKDFGTGEGGGVWQLAGKILNTQDNRVIRQYLEQVVQNVKIDESWVEVTTRRYAQQDRFAEAQQDGCKVVATFPLNNYLLRKYLSERQIDLEIAEEHCKIAVFVSNRRRLYGIGFENYSGGYEIRTNKLKMSTAPKDITLISTSSESDEVMDPPPIILFEGFMDFLSYRTAVKKSLIESYPEADFLVLNGVGLADRALSILEEKNYKELFLMLDNDEAGTLATKKIQEAFRGQSEDCRSLFEGYKDFNDYLAAISSNPTKKRITQNKIKL